MKFDRQRFESELFSEHLCLRNNREANLLTKQIVKIMVSALEKYHTEYAANSDAPPVPPEDSRTG